VATAVEVDVRYGQAAVTTGSAVLSCNASISQTTKPGE
jgi:hypothetical protein